MFAPLLGHASGFSWDEALLVLAPIAIVAAVLVLANQRAKRLGHDAPDRGSDAGGSNGDEAAVGRGQSDEDPPVTPR